MIVQKIGFFKKIPFLWNWIYVFGNCIKNIQKIIYSFLIVFCFVSRCSVPFPNFNSNLLLLPLLNANNTNNVSDPNLELKYIFVAVTGTTGQIGAGTVTGADTICTNEKNTNFTSLPGNGTDYKALIASTLAPIRRACNATPNCTNSAENVNWVLLPNQDYYKGTVTSPVKVFTTNSAGIVVFPSLSSIDSNAATTWWTGIEDNWISSPDHCANWTDGTAGGLGQFGSGNALTEISIGALFSEDCSISRKLVCVRQ
ncbi:DUF1554 domain-containing protein [Leptospira interrogans]|uniref:PF07588 family protein n=1 Tax=Leptospira interrogans str. UI 12621 TaxID=1049937 RepID=A0A0F6HA57_LEPIR|nr:DUF1554 domain-containing protein [Leptospira interrogans]EMF73270.1 PF07588 family protein [Leptospira interrogans serovar Canicola str. LT1962]ALN99687.1 hypothetical protein LIH_04875 [Leptospira interrogans serovar Hardjo-prajitno]EKO25154.1 PF07588 family protein [Leptospira interrogans str. UI 12621]EKO96570.1 PF07588 family protein [Leptospira interrogans str. Brem 329]EKR15514.1 PF07588 family protein [Leptospira interrogans serovar Pyrogenes str. 2006006960]